VVCDGFVGNVLLKVAEGVAEAVVGMLRTQLTERLAYRIGARLCAPALERVYRQISSSAYGGAQLLGVNGICIICHGSSDAEAIRNAIRVATDLRKKQINDRIIETVRSVKSKSDVKTATM